MRGRQLDRGEGAVAGNPSPEKASKSKGKELSIRLFNKSSTEQLPPAKPSSVGAGHRDTAAQEDRARPSRSPERI